MVLVGCGPPPPDISIHRATQEGNIEAVKQHLAAGTDVNEKDRFQSVSLYWAAYWGHMEIAELLISEGADVNAVSNTHEHGGLTPLHHAASKGQKEIAELLIAKGADVNAKDNVGDTPIGLADGEIAALLRKHGGKTGEKLKAEGN